MTYRPHSCVTACVLAGLATWFPGCGSREAAPAAERAVAERPNVALIVIDTLRADTVNAERNGVPVMPRLRRFAREGLDFANAATPCTWTKPAVVSMLTSLRFDAHGVRYSVDPEDPQRRTDTIPDGLQTLPVMLHDAGYRTAGIQTNPHLTEEIGLARGFDSYEFSDLARADWVTDKAIEKVRGFDGPFFLYAHYMDPHSPYEPPEEYRRLMGLDEGLDRAELDMILQWVDYFTPVAYQKLGMDMEGPDRRISPEGREATRILYDGEARYLDEQLGRLLDALERLPNTLIIVAADHGEEFWEHGSLCHGMTLYEEVMRVPLFVKGPGVSPRRVEEPVQTLDIVPTVADYVKLTPSPRWQGRSLLGEAESGRAVFSRTCGSFRRVPLDLAGVVVDGMKLVVDRKADRVELYDLRQDPAERDNLAESRPEDAQRLRAVLEAQLEQDESVRRELAPESTTGEPLDPATVEQLRSIGYGR